MNFTIECEPSGLCRAVIEDAPETVVALDMTPAKREPILNKGKWFIGCFAIWSGYDRAVVPSIGSVVNRFPDLNIGIRPFSDHEEMQTWLRDDFKYFSSPVWLLLSNGQIVAERGGVLGPDALVSFVENGLYGSSIGDSFGPRL